MQPVSCIRLSNATDYAPMRIYVLQANMQA